MIKQARLVILKEITEQNAILVAQDGQEISWPKISLPWGVKIGERLIINLSRESEAESITNPQEFLNSILSLNR